MYFYTDATKLTLFPDNPNNNILTKHHETHKIHNTLQNTHKFGRQINHITKFKSNPAKIDRITLE